MHLALKSALPVCKRARPGTRFFSRRRRTKRQRQHPMYRHQQPERVLTQISPDFFWSVRLGDMAGVLSTSGPSPQGAQNLTPSVRGEVYEANVYECFWWVADVAIPVEPGLKLRECVASESLSWRWHLGSRFDHDARCRVQVYACGSHLLFDCS